MSKDDLRKISRIFGRRSTNNQSPTTSNNNTVRKNSVSGRKLVFEKSDSESDEENDFEFSESFKKSLLNNEEEKTENLDDFQFSESFQEDLLNSEEKSEVISLSDSEKSSANSSKKSEDFRSFVNSDSNDISFVEEQESTIMDQAQAAQMQADMQRLVAQLTNVQTQFGELQGAYNVLRDEQNATQVETTALRAQLAARAQAGQNAQLTIVEMIRRAVSRVQFCDGQNVEGFILELRNLMIDFPDHEQVILRHSRTRIRDYVQFSMKDFEDLADLERALRSRYIKVKTLNTVTAEMNNLAMREGEAISEFARRARKLRDERWVALKENWSKWEIVPTQPMMNSEESNMLEAFLMGLRGEIKISMRSEYDSLEEAISHAEEVTSSIKTKGFGQARGLGQVQNYPKPGTSGQYRKPEKKTASRFKTAGVPKNKQGCFSCGAMDHIRKNCPKNQVNPKPLNSKN